MNDQTLQRIVFTGGPGSGKSTLIQALAQQGYATVTESGRSIIQSQASIDGEGVPWKNPLLYAELMLAREMQSYALHCPKAPKSRHLFYDRGIPDIAGYLMTINQPVPEHLKRAIRTYRYHHQVFLFPPWLEIYSPDRERKQSYEQAVHTYQAMVKVYTDAGYTLIEVPQTAKEQRVQFVLAQLG